MRRFTRAGFTFALMCLFLIEAGYLRAQNFSDAEDDVEFQTILERFGDIQILRFKVPGFEKLSLNQKLMIYYLYQASRAGRDIIYDQNYKYNLLIRNVLETIYKNYTGNKESPEFKEFELYLKRIWFNNGIHHSKTEMKIIPNIKPEYFKTLLKTVSDEEWVSKVAMDSEQIFELLEPIIFDPDVDSKRVDKGGEDVIKSSSVGFYRGDISQQEVIAYRDEWFKKHPGSKISWGLNSTLVKDKDSKLVEQTWKIGGRYSYSIERIVYWLKQARKVAPDKQKPVLSKLIEYYTTGDLQTYDQYSIDWVLNKFDIELSSSFIETYSDPLGYKGSFSSYVLLKDEVGSQRVQKLAANAKWFEENSPTDPEFKKIEPRGVSASVVSVMAVGGGMYPSGAIGMNLPNQEWIREQYGSKSFTFSNIHEAYDSARSGVDADEFYLTQEEKDLVRKWGALAAQVHTDMHECLGHASGKLAEGVRQDALQNYAATIEETRADLFALYYIYDKRVVNDFKIIPSLDVGKARYIFVITAYLLKLFNGVPLGRDLEEDHARNRKLMATWVYEHGKADNVIEKIQKDGKTYFRINDFDKLRDLFGELLKEVQRIKSTGDFQAAKELVETYGVKIDPKIHEEVINRYKALNMPRRRGFVTPEYYLVKEGDKIVDVRYRYPNSFAEQMLECSRLFGSPLEPIYE